MKKLFALVLAIVLVLSAGILASAEEHEPVTIQFLTGSDSTGFTEQLIENFQAEYPWITVEINYIPGNTDDIKKSLINSLNAGDSDPDVFLTDIVWTGQFASTGWIKELTGTFDSSIHSEGALQSCTYDGKLFAIPVYTDIQLLVYRSDIIGEDEVPATWQELLDVCAKYVGQNGINYGWLWQGAQKEAVVCNAVSFIGSNGGAFIRDGEIVCNSAETVEAVQFMRDMIFEYNYSPEDVLSHVPADTTPIFEQGIALFETCWPGGYAQLLSDDTSMVKDKVAITTMPVGFSGTQPASCTGGWNVAVSSYTDNEEASMLLAQYIAGEAGQRLRTERLRTLPTILALYDDADLQASVPYLADVKEAVSFGAARPASSDYASLSVVIQEHLHEALTGVKDAQTAMDELAAAMDEYL